MMEIIGMGKDQLLGLHPDSLTRPGEPPRLLTPEEVVYMAETIGALWRYNYAALEQGRPGLHAELKSGLHSDGFFVSRILLESWNMRVIMADQIVLRFGKDGWPKPKWVAGIPDGATELGKEVARIMGVKAAEMKKENGKITLNTLLPPGETLLMVEDFCTQGTGFREAVLDISVKQPGIQILRLVMVIINRGGLKEIRVENVGNFEIVPVVEYRVQDWKRKIVLSAGLDLEPLSQKPRTRTGV